MRALSVVPMKAQSARVVELPDPQVGPGRVRVRVIRVGICGTDQEIDRGEYGTAPSGAERLILGHENLGRVESLGEGASGFLVGDLVVSLVRRPDDCPRCRLGEQDLCVQGDYKERGIRGLDGFLSELYVEEPRWLVKLPPALLGAGVLLEPLSIVEKGVREAYRIQERMRAWTPARALVLGAGPVGLLGAMLLRLRGIETTVYGRDPSAFLAGRVAALGATYVASLDAQGHEVVRLAELPALHGPFDLLLEATGNAEVALGALSIIGLNGVLCLASVTEGEALVKISPAHLNLELVMGNRVVFGTVNANRIDFEQGVADLAAARLRWPGWPESLITRRVPLERFREAFDRSPGDIKVALELARDA